VHSTRRVTTDDADPHTDSAPDIVTEYITLLKAGTEMWVREGQTQQSKPKQGSSMLTRCWVDHRERVVQFDNVSAANGSAKGKGKKVEAMIVSGE
jgi:hypothetical protein